mmetsp:Transcript_3467/g.9429  ORF Transcript_3467/g.9429 Transcript_3467/m.9429 type:complete len:316 (+) Transcript_3467:774-1721(+)
MQRRGAALRLGSVRVAEPWRWLPRHPCMFGGHLGPGRVMPLVGSVDPWLESARIAEPPLPLALVALHPGVGTRQESLRASLGESRSIAAPDVVRPCAPCQAIGQASCVRRVQLFPLGLVADLRVATVKELLDSRSEAAQEKQSHEHGRHVEARAAPAERVATAEATHALALLLLRPAAATESHQQHDQYRHGGRRGARREEANDTDVRRTGLVDLVEGPADLGCVQAGLGQGADRSVRCQEHGKPEHAPASTPQRGLAAPVARSRPRSELHVGGVADAAGCVNHLNVSRVHRGGRDHDLHLLRSSVRAWEAHGAW